MTTDVPLTFVDDTARSVLALDMPVDHEAVSTAAALVAELVRRLNHTTHNDPDAALPRPADGEALLRDVQATLGRLAQLLRQVGAQFDRFDRALLGIDSRLDPADAEAVASLTATALDTAADQAHTASLAVGQAADQASRLTWRGTP